MVCKVLAQGEEHSKANQAYSPMCKQYFPAYPELEARGKKQLMRKHTSDAQMTASRRKKVNRGRGPEPTPHPVPGSWARDRN